MLLSHREELHGIVTKKQICNDHRLWKDFVEETDLAGCLILFNTSMISPLKKVIKKKNLPAP